MHTECPSATTAPTSLPPSSPPSKKTPLLTLLLYAYSYSYYYFSFIDSLLYDIDAVSTSDIEVLGCGIISWRPPPGNEGQELGYAVRFFDGDSYDTSTGYRSIQRFFEDTGRQWAVAEDLPTNGQPVYADVSLL